MVEHKLIYLARRNPKLKAEEFPEAWREHSRFAASFGSEFRQYFKSVRQCVKLLDVDLPESFMNQYDGANLLTMVSREGLLAARYMPGVVEELRKDEVRVFGEPIESWTMGAEEYCVSKTECESDRGSNVILSFLYPAQSISEAFHEASYAHAERLAHLPAAGKARWIAWNKVVDPSKAYGFGAVVEMWFGDKDAAVRAANDPAIVEALEQADIALPSRGARLVTRLNPRPEGLSN